MNFRIAICFQACATSKCVLKIACDLEWESLLSINAGMNGTRETHWGAAGKPGGQGEQRGRKEKAGEIGVERKDVIWADMESTDCYLKCWCCGLIGIYICLRTWDSAKELIIPYVSTYQSFSVRNPSIHTSIFLSDFSFWLTVLWAASQCHRRNTMTTTL